MKELTATLNARYETKAKGGRLIAVGACFTVYSALSSDQTAACAGILDRNQPALAREAFRFALDLVKGRKTSVNLDIPITLIDRGNGVDPAIDADKPKPAPEAGKS